MKKVAILLPSVAVGGAERVVQEELAYLINDARLYIELHLLFERGHLYDKFKEMGLPVVVWNAPHKSPLVLLKYLNLMRYLRREDFDILHVHLLTFFGPLAGKMFGLKVITTVHVDAKHGFWQQLCLSRSDVLLACGTQVMRNLEKFIPKQKIRLLNNAVRLPSRDKVCPEQIMAKLDLGSKNKIVLSLGRLDKQKGYDILIKAFNNVVRKRPDAVLLIGGEGPERENLKQLIALNDMDRHIKLLGLVDNVDELLQICSVYINSSRYEGLPVSLLEAMSHKKPIVATAVGGNRDLIENGKTGLLIPAERPDYIEDGLLNLLGNDKLSCNLAENAFNLVKKHYSIEKHCEVLSSEYLT